VRKIPPPLTVVRRSGSLSNTMFFGPKKLISTPNRASNDPCNRYYRAQARDRQTSKHTRHGIIDRNSQVRISCIRWGLKFASCPSLVRLTCVCPSLDAAGVKNKTSVASGNPVRRFAVHRATSGRWGRHVERTAGLFGVEARSTVLSRTSVRCFGSAAYTQLSYNPIKSYNNNNNNGFICIAARMLDYTHNICHAGQYVYVGILSSPCVWHIGNFNV